MSILAESEAEVQVMVYFLRSPGLDNATPSSFDSQAARFHQGRNHLSVQNPFDEDWVVGEEQLLLVRIQSLDER